MHDEALVQLGIEIEAARRDAGLSARELAERAGISPAYMRALERGLNPKTQRPSKPSLDALRAIAKSLNVLPLPWLELAGYTAEQAEAAPAPARGGVDYYVRLVQEAARQLNQRGPFMSARAQEMLQRLSLDFRLAASGTLRYGPEEEPRLTQLAIESCQSHMRAVSYQDEAWWRSDTGDRYLDLHEVLRAREVQVEMTRIFLVDPKNLTELLPTLERHLQLGINTYVVDKSLVPERHWRDLVIYDDVIARTAGIADAATDRKWAEFTDDPLRVESFLADFEELRETARGAGGDAEQVVRGLRGRSGNES